MQKVIKRVFPGLRYRDLSDKLPLLKNRSVAFLLHEKWSLSFFRELRKAKTFNRAIDHKRLKRVFLFGYSRGGTHNFVSRFHYMPCNFCFREQAFESAEDLFQLGVPVKNLKSWDYMALSMFGEYGLQNKAGAELSHVLLWNNRYLEYQGAIDFSSFKPNNGDRLIFYIRNIFRTLYSRDKSSVRVGRPKPRFKIDDDRFEFSLQQHRRKLKEMLHLKACYPDSVTFCFHETFCAQPEETIDDVCRFLDIPREMKVQWHPPQKFFQRCFGSDHPPELKNGKLWCNKKHRYLLGTGGKFNPLSYPSLERSMKDPIEQFISPHRYERAVEIFTQELVDFWLHDQDYPYSRKSSDHLLDLISRSVAQ